MSERFRVEAALLALMLGASCGQPPTARPVTERTERPSLAEPAVADGAAASAVQPSAELSPQVTAPPPLDADGNDDASDTGSGAAPLAGELVRVGKSRLSLQRICDLRPFAGALYAGHANAALGTDGATVSRFRSAATPAFEVAFDWNRPGQPTKGGGAGQGFTRVRAIGGRLLVPDSDPPVLGFWLSKTGTEGYVFVSSAAGEFAPPRRPGFLPPAPPRDDRPGAGLVPHALHVLDVIRFRGRHYASTGSVPPGHSPNSDHAPAALHVASDDLTRWEYALGYPQRPVGNVWRFTYLVRYRDRLYAGLQDYYGREPYDYMTFEPEKDSAQLSADDARPWRVTASGAAQTYRWYADRGKLYWIAAAPGEGVVLRVSSDGDAWEEVALPLEAGAPTDVTRFRDGLFVMTERALLRLDGLATRVVATVTEKRSPFELSDGLCAAPLAVFEDRLYVGGQRDGALYRLEHAP